MVEYDISPTEAMRKGIAVHLCDIGFTKYNNELNQQRSKFVKEFLEYMNTKHKKEMIDQLMNAAKTFTDLVPELLEEAKNERKD